MNQACQSSGEKRLRADFSCFHSVRPQESRGVEQCIYSNQNQLRVNLTVFRLSVDAAQQNETFRCLTPQVSQVRQRHNSLLDRLAARTPP